MNVAILNIGDELLIGQVVNTNAAQMAQLFTAAGMTVVAVATTGDTAEGIRTALRQAMAQADAVVCTGGLGPTKDDITRTVLMQLFGGTLVEHAGQLAVIESIFARRGYPLTPINRLQSHTPSSCTTLVNTLGTAPGMWFEAEGGRKVVVSLPGVPFEAMHLMETEVVPRLQRHFGTDVILTKNILTQGIGESFLSDLIEPWETALPANLALAYLPAAGLTKLRITARGSDRAALQRQIDEAVQALYPLAGPYIAGEDCETLAELTAQIFTARGLTLATAESCTGGYLASRLTALAGCSAYYRGGVVAYSNAAKVSQLGVLESTLAQHGAVSEATALAMARGAQQRMGSHYAIATTGIAGPDGGTASKPVGTVWIAVATPQGVFAERQQLGGSDRQRVIERTANRAFSLLVKAVREQN